MDDDDGPGSVSGLSSLEDDADEFEKRMIQTARDERRRNDALHGGAPAFRKARTHPRVGLTMANLDRTHARIAGVAASPTGSTQSSDSATSERAMTSADPAMHAPPSWGRKSRTNRNWMRSIAHEEGQSPQPQQPLTPAPAAPDSPLSHKSSLEATQRSDRSPEWDLTFELNEASLIASTPYIARSTRLDDIRKAERESAEQPRKRSPPHRRQDSHDLLRRLARVSPRMESNSQSQRDVDIDYVFTEEATKPKAIKSKAVPSEAVKLKAVQSEVVKTKAAHSQVITRKSVKPEAVDSEIVKPEVVNLEAVDSEVVEHKIVEEERSHAKPITEREPEREKRTNAELESEREKSTSPEQEPARENSTKPKLESEPRQDSRPTSKLSLKPNLKPDLKPDLVTEDVDITPIPLEHSILNPKTPVVTGAWVDTPAPRTLQRNTKIPRNTLISPIKRSPRKNPTTALSVIRPNLPTSALQALISQAKSTDRRPSTDFGDSTMNSLQELIIDSSDAAMDEDTLQGLQLPTETPRNEAERQRQQELLHLHRMNDRLRAARTSIRDASRGMKRVEDQVEHADEDCQGHKVGAIRYECPCASSGAHQFSLWRWAKSLVWQDRLKTLRQASNSNWKVWGGLTGLGIFLTVFIVWLISEEVACEIYCHHLYAYTSPYPFGVNMDAPEYPFVIPTMVYRNLIKSWWLPIWTCLSWVGTSVWCFTIGGIGNERASFLTSTAGEVREAMQGTATVATQWASGVHSQVTEDVEWDQRMMDDERM